MTAIPLFAALLLSAVGDELRIHSGGRTHRHSPYQGKATGPMAGRIGLATIRRDHFVSLEASLDGGRIVTKPLKLAGKGLHLNAQSNCGAIVIEALPRGVVAGDPAGKAIARSQPIRRDGLDSRVEWAEGSLEGLDTPVVPRITLKNACLYTLWCS